MTLLSLLNKRDGAAAAAGPVAEVQRLLVDIKAERRTLEEVLSSPGAAGVSAFQTALDQAEQRASALARQLDELSVRAEKLGRTAGAIDTLDARVVALEETLRGADARVARTLERAAELDDQRWALQEMTTLAQTTLTRLEALKADDDITRLAEQMPTVRDECLKIRDQQAALVNEADVLRAKTGGWLQEASAAAETSREACERVDRAASRIQEVQRKLEDVAQGAALAQDTTTQLQALNALAEHVSLKLKALESQHQTVERALVDSRRVGEMVWEMEVQIGKLNEGSALASRVEEDLGRLERLQQEVAAKLEESAADRTRWTQQTEQQQREALELQQGIQENLERLTVRRKEMDTLAERLRTAQAGLADAERRLASVTATERTMAAIGEKVETLSSQVGAMTVQAQALEEKQGALTVLEDRLEAAGRAARDAALQIEGLAERRKDLDALKATFDTFDAIHAAARRLADELRDDKQEFARFVQQAGEFMNSVPQIQAAMEGLGSRVAETEERAALAVAMSPRIDELTGRLDGLTPRLQIAEALQERLSDLHELSAENDRRLTAQLERQAELEQMRVACDGLATQTAEAHHRLKAIEDVQTRLAALAGQVAHMESGVSAARERLSTLQRDEEALASQERRMADLHESARALSVESTGQLERVRAIQADLAGAALSRDELYAGLASLQALQRDASAASRETGLQLQELAARAGEIEERRARLAAAEQAIAAVEARCRSLDDLAADVSSKVAGLAERDRVIAAVRQELDAIHAISKKSQEDLAALADRRAEIAEGRTDLERLAAALADATAKIADVERRSGAVDDVRRKAEAAVRLLDDARLTLEAISEQKAMVDHAAEMFARFDTVIADAKGTTQVLQSERKLAQRIAENVRNIHARAGADIRQVG